MNTMIQSFAATQDAPANPAWPARARAGQWSFWLWAWATVAASAAHPPDLSVPLSAGETRLADIGLYQVVWQSYGQEPVAMPISWSGHFDERTGISYQSWGKVLGRESILMHSPWRVAPGKEWVDYQLALPRARPITLAFGIAMGPDVAVPGRSDGVTFSCHLLANGQPHELMRKHHDQGAWLDYSFDLSAYAGQTVTVRLQVEPGPKNNASFDYSFFGDAREQVGTGKENTGDVVKRLIGARAGHATAKASRVALSNTPKNGVTPSNLLPAANSLTQAGSSWRFVYEGLDSRLVYTYEPQTGTLDDFTAQVDDGRVFQPAWGGGATAEIKQGGKTEELPLRDGRAVKLAKEGEALQVLWEYDCKGRPIRLAWTFQMVGKALVVSARCDEPVVTRFSLGAVGQAPLRQTVRVPYLPGQVHYLPVQNVFICRYLDWTVSHSSQCPQGVATYSVKTDGTRNPLVETGYLAVSPEVDEVLPNIPHPPSPFVATLGPRVMLDIWGHHQGRYAGDAAKLRELKDNGVDHVVIIQHDWQRYGYDVKLPDHLPANPRYGGDEGMKIFGEAARDCGYIWSLHENYIDLYPDAPSYDPAARVLQADGTPSLAWYNPGTKVQSFGLKCNRALGYAKQNSPEAHRRFGTSAGYLDVHSSVVPWHQLDREVTQPMAAMELLKVQRDAELFQFEREAHGGPIFGEGANHFYWAGRCDGVEAQVEGGEDHAAFLDFDLLKIHPQMVNHGMGYLERWFRRGYNAEYGRDAGSIEQLDKYRAMELAYGHAGFLGDKLVHTVQTVVREHHLMHAVQRLYGTAKPTGILYEVEGQWVSGSLALVAGETTRQRIRYDSGLTLWVNWRAEPWRVGESAPESREAGADFPAKSGLRVLPQWGFLAIGPGTEVWTALRDGKVADYAVCPEYVFADARTWFDLPYRHAKKNIEPRLRSAEYLGRNRLRVTYEWIINDTLGANNRVCFVHGLNPAETGGQNIVFQGDHGLAKPTSLWRPGEVIVDGPHELQISDRFDSYDLVMGLYQGERVSLEGADQGSGRILVARLKVGKHAGQITNIIAEKFTGTTAVPDKTVEADFKAHTNPSGTWIDFGALATDGAVKINREADRLVLFPYPREKSFRVSFDLKALAPQAEPARVQVHALAAGTQEDLGPVEARLEGTRVMLNLGRPGVGRYAVTWGR